MVNRCDNCPLKRNEKCTLFDLNLRLFTRIEIEKDLVQALNMVLVNEGDLLRRDVHERTISFHLGYYFRSMFGDKYAGYNIDPEYNRNGNDSKYYYNSVTERHIAIPDLIIHRRNCNKYNLLYLEVKKGNHDDDDMKKTKKFMSNEIIGSWGGKTPTLYRFKNGVSVAINENLVSLKWYITETNRWIQSDYQLIDGSLQKKTCEGQNV